MDIKGLFITDFDGTLYNHALGFDILGLQGMDLLKQNGIVRVVATGRSNFLTHPEIVPADFTDYVIFSSGSVIYDAARSEALYKAYLGKARVQDICATLKDLGLNFMVQKVWPDNHNFVYWPQESQIADFRRRLALYADHSVFNQDIPHIDATEIITIVNPERRLEVADTLTKKFPDTSVITATSPLDNTSIWLEIFPKDISKSQTCAKLAKMLNCDTQPTAAIGNDYNDLDMLHWADYGYVVANTPKSLWHNFRVVAPVGQGGVFDAATNFIANIQNG